MKSLPYLFALCFLLGCITKSGEQPKENIGIILDKESREQSIDITRGQEIIKLVTDLADTFGLLKLPYQYGYNQGFVGGIQYGDINYKPNYNRLRQLLKCDAIVGILPDTTNYFGLVVGLAASVVEIELVTVDKNGSQIARETLIENNCLHYVEEDIYCREHVTLSSKLRIDYSYETLYVLDGVNGRDTICETKTKSGIVLPNGAIEFDESTMSRCK